MPVDLGYRDATFVVRASGAVTFAEVQRVIGEIDSDPRMRLHPCVLVDARECDDVPTTPELRRIAADIGPLVKRGLGPIAIVTNSNFVYGIARMFSTFAEAVCAKVHPFRALGDAKRWLRAEQNERQLPSSDFSAESGTRVNVDSPDTAD